MKPYNVRGEADMCCEPTHNARELYSECGTKAFLKGLVKYSGWHPPDYQVQQRLSVLTASVGLAEPAFNLAGFVIIRIIYKGELSWRMPYPEQECSLEKRL